MPACPAAGSGVLSESLDSDVDVSAGSVWRQRQGERLPRETQMLLKDTAALTVLMGTYNRLELLKQCLSALFQCPNCHVVVMDAGSTDGTVEYLATCSDVTVIPESRRLGQARSLNSALRSVRTPYVCWLSDDNVVQPGMLDMAWRILDRHVTVGMVALKVKDVTGTISHMPYIGFVWPSGVLNCNQGVLRTEWLREHGGFSEEFMDYGMDPDLTTRVLLDGLKVVYTRGVAILHYREHDAPISWADSDTRKQKMERAHLLYAQKYSALFAPPGGHPWLQRVDRLNSVLLRFVRRLLALCSRAGLPLERMAGISERDWTNILESRFISKWDLFKNLGRPYYLVQRIPANVRAGVGLGGRASGCAHETAALG